MLMPYAYAYAGIRHLNRYHFVPVFVDTSATGTKQCEAITNVAIRIMRLRGMDEQRKIEIYCVMI